MKDNYDVKQHITTIKENKNKSNTCPKKDEKISHTHSGDKHGEEDRRKTRQKREEHDVTQHIMTIKKKKKITLNSPSHLDGLAGGLVQGLERLPLLV